MLKTEFSRQSSLQCRTISRAIRSSRHFNNGVWDDIPCPSVISWTMWRLLFLNYTSHLPRQYFALHHRVRRLFLSLFFFTCSSFSCSLFSIQSMYLAYSIRRICNSTTVLNYICYSTTVTDWPCCESCKNFSIQLQNYWSVGYKDSFYPQMLI